MNTKHTFWTLCEKYNKIEVPIIQRDYAQGRETADVERIRKKFINEYLIDSLLRGEKIELDFVYGSVLTVIKEELKEEIFIPLDGQQRLTTLFLLHWFIASKEDRIKEAKDNLLKFTYETRPSAHDFCTKLILERISSDNLHQVKDYILNSEWYDDEWNNDPTVTGMLTMLETFAKNERLMNYPSKLFDSLLNIEKSLISFYFIPLERFGLTENLYIRMNARGKMLTDFENFKSEFYKIIVDFPDLLEEIKDKIEYAWVENLWDYKGKDCYVVDRPFMQYLSFITEMLYFKDAKFRASFYESDFLDFKVLKEIYTKEENLKFLIFAFDSIKITKKFNDIDWLWIENTSVHDILKSILEGKRDTNQLFILFFSLSYYYSIRKTENLNDFIRVVRNLIQNTTVNSRREWPKLFKSISNLIQDTNVYEILQDERSSELLDGFYVPQRKEEIVKANLIKLFPNCKDLIFIIEDNKYLKGNIESLLASNFVSSESELTNFDISKMEITMFNIEKMSSIYECYIKVSDKNFNNVWGDLLVSSLYTQLEWSRLTYNSNYSKHPSVISLAIDLYQSSESNLNSFLVLRRKSFINDILKQNQELSEVRNVKDQLYLYYILHINICNKGVSTFFRNGYNFGWLKKETGFSSIFCKGIENDRWAYSSNPIFQTYQSQFRYNCGLKIENALDEEVVGTRRKHNPFELLIAWANNVE